MRYTCLLRFAPSPQVIIPIYGKRLLPEIRHRYPLERLRIKGKVRSYLSIGVELRNLYHVVHPVASEVGKLRWV